MPRYLVMRQGALVGGRFEVQELLGMGGTSAVYAVRRLEDGGRFALKLCKFAAADLPRAAVEEYARRLQRELATLQALNHPNVVRVFEQGLHDGMPFLVQEQVEGTSLALCLQRRRRPALYHLMAAYAHLVRAVAYLHERGICHRDIKPNNVLLRENHEPVLVDFGACQPPCVNERLTSPGALVGTLQYVCPEYAAYLLEENWRPGRNPQPYTFNPRHDVYALGVLLYELLTGTVPSVTPPEHREALLREIRDVVPAHPTELNPHVPRSLAELALTLLEKDSSRRPGHAGEVLQALPPTMASAVESGLLFTPAPECFTPEDPSWLWNVSGVEVQGLPSSSPIPQRHAWRRTAWFLLVSLLTVVFVVGRPAWCPASWKLSSQVEPAACIPGEQSGALPTPTPVSQAAAATWPSPHDPRRCPYPAVWCASVSACVVGGCATITLPDSMPVCLPEAMAATRRWAIPASARFDGHLLVGPNVAPTGRGASGPYVVKNGRVEVAVDGPIPQGSLLGGTLRQQGDRVQLRLDTLRLPDGTEQPFCAFAYGLDDRVGMAVSPVSHAPADTFVVEGHFSIRRVEYWPAP